ncbi:MAG: single-stranded-DNA-specific exonuclease RecJ [bacterium]
MKWIYESEPDKKVLSSLQKQNKKLEAPLSDPVITLISKLNITELEDFLFPDDDFFSPSLIPNIEVASKFIIEAIEKKTPIIIHGDFDADGITATSILFDFLYFKCEANVVPYIPSRVDEGYGLSNESLGTILTKQDGKTKPLIISVDCGVKDNDLVDDKWYKDFDFIITDHHEMKKVEDKIVYSKKAKAIVHPRFPGSKYPFQSISGASVAWKLVCQISKDFPKLKGYDPNEYLDLVAISTICDLMPLLSENRKFVKFGLERLNNTNRLGLIELLKVSGLIENGRIKKLDTYHIGFVIGPRLNATGRLGKAIDAVKLLCTRSTSQAEKIASEINNLNIERQNITKELFLEAKEQANGKLENRIITIKGKNWPEGIVGLIAGKLTEEFARPSIVFAISEDKVTASARSTKTFNITETLSHNSKHLIRFGGHAGAAGLSLHADKLDLFIEEITTYTNLNFPVSESGEIEKELTINLKAEIKELSLKLAKELSQLEPFGMENPEPVFSLSNLRVVNISKMGQMGTHIRVTLQDIKSSETISAIGFNMVDKCESILPGDKVDLAFNIKINRWNGNESLEILIKDIKKIFA